MMARNFDARTMLRTHDPQHKTRSHPDADMNLSANSLPPFNTPGKDSGYSSSGRSSAFTPKPHRVNVFDETYRMEAISSMNNGNMMIASPPSENFHIICHTLGVMSDEVEAVDSAEAYYYHRQLESAPVPLSTPGTRSSTIESIKSFEISRGYRTRVASSALEYPSTYDHFGQYIFLPSVRGFGRAAFHGAPASSHSNNLFHRLSKDQSEAKYPGLITRPGHFPVQRPASKTRQDERFSAGSSGTTSTKTDGSPENRDSIPVGPTAENFEVAIPHRVKEVAAAVLEQQGQLEAQLGPGALQSFRPSYSALKSMGLLPNLDSLRASVASINYGGSEKYLGDVTIAHNRSANIPDSQNCSLWIMGLPGNVTHRLLLGAIREVGKVYATVINPPTGAHLTSAAKIVFFERSDAEKLFSLIIGGSFNVMGHRIRDVRWNKIKVPQCLRLEQSRAIQITGPRMLMDFDFFEMFFRFRFTYDLDWRGEVPCRIPEMVSHEWHFGSLRCQAASAKTAIERELHGIFSVRWALDPCAGP